ncbi:hypothetical protein ACBJ59_36675 [Nonomuraea sp. MTCD27]|uniref:hypothetical protein n=1 Tax=Nonomuraea sp. MTCD27 TaxID=1676747 RepID=UPI0035BFF67E
MNKQDIAYAVSLTLDGHADDFDINAVVEEIGDTYGWDIKSIDDIPSDEYWAIVEKHDTTTI